MFFLKHGVQQNKPTPRLLTLNVFSRTFAVFVLHCYQLVWTDV